MRCCILGDLMTDEMQRPYSLNPLPIVGCAVRGIDLTQPLAPNIIESIKHDTSRYRLLVFKDQPASISGARHVVCLFSSVSHTPQL